MKEVNSQSKWVGKILTCSKCLRSFEIEAGDEILPGFTSGSSKHYLKKNKRFILKCGHEFPLLDTELKPDEDVTVPKYQMLTEGYNPDDLKD